MKKKQDQKQSKQDTKMIELSKKELKEIKGGLVPFVETSEDDE